MNSNKIQKNLQLFKVKKCGDLGSDSGKKVWISSQVLQHNGVVEEEDATKGLRHPTIMRISNT